MGSCISKCKPKEKTKKDCIVENHHQEFCHVHDKLVIISQPPKSSTRKPFSPSPSPASSTSFSSVSANASSEFLTTSSSCSSSVSISKDRSFSNEFLWACARENPQIIGRNVIKGSLLDHKYDFPALHKKPSYVVPTKQAVPGSHGGTTPKKRARANSPTLVRQKSFRKEPDKVSSSNITYHLPPNRTLLMRSPSPSRRFNGDTTLRDSPMNALNSRRSSVPKTNGCSYLSSPSLRRENVKTPRSPNYYLTGTKSGTMMNTRNAFNTEQVGSRNGKADVGERELANYQDLEAMVVEDIHNPLIALDCFIFL